MLRKAKVACILGLLVSLWAFTGCFDTATMGESQSPCTADSDCRSGFQCVALGEPYTYGNCVESSQIVMDATVDIDLSDATDDLTQADTNLSDTNPADTSPDIDTNVADQLSDLTNCNGQNVDLQTDAGHCGACGVSCDTDHTSDFSCVAGVCIIACDSHHEDCDSDPMNGCEVNTDDDDLNCGGCDHACATLETCQGGVCLGRVGMDCNSDHDCLSDKCETLHNATFCTISCNSDGDCGSESNCAANICVPYSQCRPSGSNEWRGPACLCSAFCSGSCQQNPTEAECN